MTDVRLPDPLRAALDAIPGDRHAAIDLSSAYRAMRPSSEAVARQSSAAAYVATRMPATYAALVTALSEVAARAPAFMPKSLLDAGAGPGTASWAAVSTFPDLARITMLDSNACLLDLAGTLASASPDASLSGAERILGSLRALPFAGRQFDLVIASYALTELADAAIVAAAEGLWKACDGVLVIVEPGRTRDYQRLMRVRDALFAAGATIVAPCPHRLACPLLEGDWCHFSVRLPRSRAHMQAKGGTLGYEDEKFSYLVVSRAAVAARPAAARLIRQPEVGKGEIALSVCGVDGLATRRVPRRDASAYKAAKKLDWGDGID